MLSDIYDTAVESVGLPVHPDSDAVRMFRLVLAEGRSLIRQRDEIEVRAVELLSDLPDYQLLTTIPGIGPINAMTRAEGPLSDVPWRQLADLVDNVRAFCLGFGISY